MVLSYGDVPDQHGRILQRGHQFILLQPHSQRFQLCSPACTFQEDPVLYTDDTVEVPDLEPDHPDDTGCAADGNASLHVTQDCTARTADGRRFADHVICGQSDTRVLSFIPDTGTSPVPDHR